MLPPKPDKRSSIEYVLKSMSVEEKKSANSQQKLYWEILGFAYDWQQNHQIIKRPNLAKKAVNSNETNIKLQTMQNI